MAYLPRYMHLIAFDMQVYTLEKVLQLKRDQITQVTFLEEVMTVRDLVRCISIFLWLFS